MKGNTPLPHRKPINLLTGFFAEHQRPKALDCGRLSIPKLRLKIPVLRITSRLNKGQQIKYLFCLQGIEQTGWHR